MFCFENEFPLLQVSPETSAPSAPLQVLFYPLRETIKV